MKDLAYRVDTNFDTTNGEITQLHGFEQDLLSDVRQKLHVDIIKTKDAQVRQALINMGWTPPEEKQQ